MEKVNENKRTAAALAADIPVNDGSSFPKKFPDSITTLTNHSSNDYILHLCLSQPLSLFASASANGYIRFHSFDAPQSDIKTLQQSIVAHPSSPISDLHCFNTHPHLFLSTARDGFVNIWDVRLSTSSPPALQFSPTNSIRAPILSGTINSSDQQVAVASGNTIFIHDLRNTPMKSSERLLGTLQFHSDVVSCVRFHPFISHLLLSGGEDCMIALATTHSCNQEIQKEAFTFGEGSFSHAYNYKIPSTNHLTEEEALISCFSNEQMVKSLSFTGPQADVICCIGTTEVANIWQISGMMQFADHATINEWTFDGCIDLTESRNYSSNPTIAEASISDLKIGKFNKVVMRENPLLQHEDSGGYIVDSFYDDNSKDLFLLGGTKSGHTGVVRCALSLSHTSNTMKLVTGGEDGCLCIWEQKSVDDRSLAIRNNYRKFRPTRATPY
ncbi:WD domain, G-beta repeat-containing protein [Cardiosporidium cionae]|uniref:WD domain, G-beta repeat-containing protein n=1 Tax=Cardiosporidium cionae TaxID=476202 RepID=A0ABQ7JDI8_9APIC|nr:WD domain, G-beta repeat-containing protein [Cardiosporidium cionae]|eukprot:KAF8822046.1 WD domain, G-beta repeat-containing protein [Cardiosporidium cionae]